MTTNAVTTKVLPWLLTVALLAGAWGLSKITLPEDTAQAPFPTVAVLDEPATARNLTVTITDVRAALRVVDVEGWSAEGTWVIVDLDAAAHVTQELATLELATLTIGDRTFSATDRGTTFADHRLITGVPRSGSLAFELPEDALNGIATLRLGTPHAEQLDGVIELVIDLDDLPVEAEVQLHENGWAR